MSIKSLFQNIATAIKEKNPDVTTITPGNMPQAILDISGGLDGIIIGNTIPSASEGNNGDYYYLRTNNINGNAITFGSFNASSQSVSGWEFTPIINLHITKLKTYQRGSTTGSIGICNTSGNIIFETSTQSFTSGWNEIDISSSNIILAAGINYIIFTRLNSAGTMGYVNSSNVTVNTNYLTYVRGRYGSIPGTNESGILYSSNFEFEITGNYYYITNQYIKENNIWVQLV